MLRTMETSKLDGESLAYLQRVKRSGGRGTAGLYVSGSEQASGWLYLIIGVVVMPLFLWIGYTTNKPAWANAMIQTAGVLLGGWMIVAFLRLSVFGQGKLGNFVLLDPNRVYVANGEEFQFADLDGETEAEPVGEKGLGLKTSEGKFLLPLPERSLALIAADYYDALSHLRSKDDPRWNACSEAELGAVAKFMVRNDREPQSLNEVEIEVEELLEEVRPNGGPSFGFMRYVVILAAGVAVFFLFMMTNAPLAEGGAYEAAKAGGPAKMRDYLINPNINNEVNRKDIETLLAKQYDAPIQTIRDRAKTDPAMAEAFVKLLDSLRGPETPAVSLDVQSPGDLVNSTWTTMLRERLADGIGTTVGPELIVFVQKPADKSALISLKYGSIDNAISYTVDFRLRPDDERPYATFTKQLAPGAATTTMSEAIYNDFMVRTVGQAPPAAKAPVDDGGDW